MTLEMLEKAALIVYEICKEHPEICPHDYSWDWTDTVAFEEHYTCNLCGDEKVIKI